MLILLATERLALRSAGDVEDACGAAPAEGVASPVCPVPPPPPTDGASELGVSATAAVFPAPLASTPKVSSARASSVRVGVLARFCLEAHKVARAFAATQGSSRPVSAAGSMASRAASSSALASRARARARAPPLTAGATAAGLVAQGVAAAAHCCCSPRRGGALP